MIALVTHPLVIFYGTADIASFLGRLLIAPRLLQVLLVSAERLKLPVAGPVARIGIKRFTQRKPATNGHIGTQLFQRHPTDPGNFIQLTNRCKGLPVVSIIDNCSCCFKI